MLDIKLKELGLALKRQEHEIQEDLSRYHALEFLLQQCLLLLCLNIKLLTLSLQMMDS